MTTNYGFTTTRTEIDPTPGFEIVPLEVDGEDSVAQAGEEFPPNCTYGDGATEDDAIADFARNAEIPLWNEEGFQK